MLHVYVIRFDLTENVEKFWELKQGVASDLKRPMS